MKYKSQLREQSESINAYLDYFKYAIREFENMLKSSIYDDKKRSTFTTSIQYQKYSPRLMNSYFNIAKTSTISKLKYSVQQGVIPKGFANKVIKGIKDVSGLNSLSSDGYTKEIEAYITACRILVQKLSKL